MSEFASFESRSRRTGFKEQGCVPGSEIVSPQMQFAATPRICLIEGPQWPLEALEAPRQFSEIFGGPRRRGAQQPLKGFESGGPRKRSEALGGRAHCFIQECKEKWEFKASARNPKSPKGIKGAKINQHNNSSRDLPSPDMAPAPPALGCAGVPFLHVASCRHAARCPKP